MNEKLKALFEQWNIKHDGTPEFELACQTFCKDDKKTEVLFNGMAAESEQAFAAGFRTAVQLLMGGVQS